MMKTVQMTLDEELLASVDQVIEKLHTTRSSFTRTALKSAIQKFHITELEKKHAKGYQVRPVGKNEFKGWEKEQNWGDE